MNEEWRFVAGTNEKWQVSSLGRAAKWGKVIPKKRIHVPKRGSVRIYRLILEAFVGPCPLGMECCHLDDNHANNALSNLRWGTKEENQIDAIRNGNGNNILTEDNVREAIVLHRSNPSVWNYVTLGRKYKVTPETISMAVRGLTWKRLQKEVPN